MLLGIRNSTLICQGVQLVDTHLNFIWTKQKQRTIKKEKQNNLRNVRLCLVLLIEYITTYMENMHFKKIGNIARYCFNTKYENLFIIYSVIHHSVEAIFLIVSADGCRLCPI